jgi:uncharacterized protein with PQ loop repeat
MPIVFHNHVIDKLAIVAGIASGLALYPQIWMILSAHSLAGVSVTTYVIMLLNSFVWLAYSMHRGLFSLGITSLLNIIATGTVVAYALSFTF